jgi:hypothetical protein
MLKESVPKPMNDLDVYSHIKYKLTRAVPPPGTTPPMVRTFFTRNRQASYLSKGNWDS